MVTRRYSPTNTREQAERIRKLWDDLSVDELGGIGRNEFEILIQQYDARVIRLDGLRYEIREESIGKLDDRFSLWQAVRSTRIFVGARYGWDSAQYQLAGGTRTSDRRARRPSPSTNSGIGITDATDS